MESVTNKGVVYTLLDYISRYKEFVIFCHQQAMPLFSLSRIKGFLRPVHQHCHTLSWLRTSVQDVLVLASFDIEMAPKKTKKGKAASKGKPPSSKTPPKNKASGVKKPRRKARATTTKQADTVQPIRRSARLAAPNAPLEEDNEDASQASEASETDGDIGQSGIILQNPVAAQGGKVVKPAHASQADDAHQRYDTPKVAALAEISDVVECDFQGSPARLRTTLQVHQDPQAPPYLLGYRILLQLDRSSDGEPRWENAGYIDSWRIDKTTAAHPDGTKDAWHRELLAPSIDEAWPDMKQEAAYCLKALYTKQGQPMKKIKNLDREALLASQSLLFIQMIYFHEAFQRQGLLRRALSSYHKLLGQLPEWFAFAGVVVLVPSRPDGARGSGWGKLDDDAVVATLETIYTNTGYERWVSSVVSETRVVVMGRTVPYAPELAVASNVHSGDENTI